MAKTEELPLEPRNERSARVKKLREAGISAKEIARLEGVSHQRIDQIIHNTAHECRRRTRYLVKIGKLPNPKTLKCYRCGAQATGYDHRDYSNSVKVKAVCSLCNSALGPGKNSVDSKCIKMKKNIGITNLIPMSVDLDDAAKKLGIGRSYLMSILQLKIRPGAPLTLRICSVFELVEPYMLRPDIFTPEKNYTNEKAGTRIPA